VYTAVIYYYYFIVGVKDENLMRMFAVDEQIKRDFLGATAKKITQCTIVPGTWPCRVKE